MGKKSGRKTAASTPITATSPFQAPRRFVTINGVAITDDSLTAIEGAWGATIADGVYWYDPLCGAWGMQGGACVGYCAAGLQLGGPLQSNASNGQTGVFINGRELPLLEFVSWQCFGLSAPGRYWVDAQGNYGVEGGPMLGNLARGAPGTGAPWTVHSRFNRFGTAGGDGSDFLFFSDGKHFWLPKARPRSADWRRQH
jgi:hypothetical protein